VDDLSSAWNPAPAVLAGAGLALLMFVQAFVRLRGRGRSDHAGWPRFALFLVALAAGVLPLVSPLDEVGDSYLLSGHMLQHVLIGDVAPALGLAALRGPLVLFMVPAPLLRALSRLRWLRAAFGTLLRPSVSFALWIAVVAAWHVPSAYDYALAHDTVHDLEHVSFIVTGVLVWMQVVDPARQRHLRDTQRLVYMSALVGAGSVLAAMLVLLRSPLYPAYAGEGARLFGIAPLQDQRLAGLVMAGEQFVALGICCALFVCARLDIRLLPLRRRLAAAGLES
jgi:cytochrome c oxidase assembly factor CtaG